MNASKHDCAPIILGIDLGTSNSALAFCKAIPSKEVRYEVLDVKQWVALGQVGTQKVLPSFVYISHEGEISSEETCLPWEISDQGLSKEPQHILGAWARERGMTLPDRLISSAKSWLGYPLADRMAPILPWGSEIKAGKLSPVKASALYLNHLVSAFEDSKPEDIGHFDRSMAHVVLTVPASFDEAARNLTYEAATSVGLERLHLLEEPLAAFYAWLAYQGDTWREHVKPGDVILVCDIGGGTSDFTLIAVVEDEGGELKLERVSVGDHLLLGGDNMDLALAFAVRQQLEEDGRSLDHWQFLSLIGQVRPAKEKILTDPSINEIPLAIAGKGSSLFAQVLSTSLSRTMVESVIVEGFFPLIQPGDYPVSRRLGGVHEFGLPYESEAAITRHLAKFLHRSLQNLKVDLKKQELVSLLKFNRLDDVLLMPTAVLFNGGVFKSSLLRHRVLELLRSWSREGEIRELPSQDLDLAVALGAAYFGRMSATGEGIRVASGTARSYYLGLESPMPAIPGYVPQVKGLCVVPQGTNEGTSLALPYQKFGLVVGEPIEFRFFSSNARPLDSLGTVVSNATRDLEESSKLSITLPTEGHSPGDLVPVTIEAHISEIGILQIYLQEVQSERKWQVQFNVRAYDQV